MILPLTIIAIGLLSLVSGRDPLWLAIVALIHIRAGLIGVWVELRSAAIAWWQHHPERVAELRREVAA